MAAEKSKKLRKVKNEEASKSSGRPRWKTRTAHVVGRVPVDGDGRAVRAGDVGTQLQLCLDDLTAQLQHEQLSLSDITAMTVRTTDFPAARARAGELGRWQREHGAWEKVRFEAVRALEPRGSTVEVEVRATHRELVAGRLPDSTPNQPVPEHLRAAIRAELDALVRGERPDDLYWVEEYGEDGAALVEQPEEIWHHQETSADHKDGGEWWVVLPLWTVEECPSELMAEVKVDPSGKATLRSVRVM